MRILILSQWYYPETVSGKINTLGEDLIKMGYEVTCFTGFPNYPQGKLYNGYKIRLFQKEKKDGVEILRFPVFINHSKNKLKRIFNYFSLCISTSVIGLFFAKNHDVIFLYDSLLAMGIPALLFSKIFKLPFVFEIQDMYPETLSATGMINSKSILNIVGKYSIYICKKANKISVISEGFKNNLVMKNINKNKIHVIPNWADEQYFYPQNVDVLLLENYKINKTFNIIYAGNIGIAQNLENVILVAKSLINVVDLRFIFVGDGSEKKQLETLVLANKIKNVIFIPQKPFEEISKYLALADVLLIHLRKEQIFEITIPSKAIAYLAVGKPILCVSIGEVEQLIKTARAGKVCSPSDPSFLSKAIIDMYNLSKEELIQMGVNGRNYYEQNFKKQIIMPKYKNIFEDLTCL